MNIIEYFSKLYNASSDFESIMNARFGALHEGKIEEQEKLTETALDTALEMMRYIKEMLGGWTPTQNKTDF